MVVYMIKNTINDKVYIGQTRRSLDQRIREHQTSSARGENFYIGAAIRKYGWNNFSVSVLAETDDIDELNRLEHDYIQKYKSDVHGYNLAPGGFSNTMDSSKVKKIHDDKMRSEEVRSKISVTMKKRIAEEGRKEEYLSNLRAGFDRYKHSDKFKEDCKKRHLSPEHYRALNDSKNKEVFCIDESGEEIARFPRVKDAAYWWWEHGYNVKDYTQLMDKIKESYKYDKFIRGLKWIYCA